MPIECTHLRDEPPPIKSCPKCGDHPFIPCMRGSVQRRMVSWFVGPLRPYCAIICQGCKEIVGWELPPDFKDRAYLVRNERYMSLAFAGIVLGFAIMAGVHALATWRLQ